MTFSCIKCEIHKYTKIQIRKYTNTKCLEDQTCAIFLKSMGFKDIKYDIPVYFFILVPSIQHNEFTFENVSVLNQLRGGVVRVARVESPWKPVQAEQLYSCNQCLLVFVLWRLSTSVEHWKDWYPLGDTSFCRGALKEKACGCAGVSLNCLHF